MKKKENKKGYLEQDFKLFHLKDKATEEMDFHYHDFCKIVIFISGNVSYVIEGKSYKLQPWDILLVDKYDVHKPIVDTSVDYERIVIYVQSDYISSKNDEETDITTCFRNTKSREFHLVRLNKERLFKLQSIIGDLEDSLFSKEFGNSILSEALFVEMMVYINRFFEDTITQGQESLKYDKQISEVLKYINYNLTEDLSNEAIAEKFFLSKYHLMHKFKAETGYTMHNYVIQKRLIKASNMIKDGMSISKAAEEAGFSDYSSFLRAYRKRYNTSPREINE